MDYTSFSPGNKRNYIPPKLSKLSHKIFTPKFFGALAVILVLGGTAYGALWMWSDKNSQVVVPTFTPRDETAVWKTYANTKYGFEIKYPASMPIKDYYTEDGKRFGLDFDYQEPSCSDCGGAARYLDIEISSEKPASCESIGEEKGDSISIGGEEVATCLSAGSYFGEGTGLFINFTHGSNNYFISADFYDKNQQEVDQILSTFRFIEPGNATETSAWRTYTNTEYGFEIKLPDYLPAYIVKSEVRNGATYLNFIVEDFYKGNKEDYLFFTLFIYQLNSKNIDPFFKSREIESNSKYLAGYIEAQSAPYDFSLLEIMKNFREETPKVLSTFRFIK